MHFLLKIVIFHGYVGLPGGSCRLLDVVYNHVYVRVGQLDAAINSTHPS